MMDKKGKAKKPDAIKVFSAEDKDFVEQPKVEEQPEIVEQPRAVEAQLIVEKKRLICPSCGRNITVDDGCNHCPFCKCDLTKGV